MHRQTFKLDIVTEPAIEPVTVAEVKNVVRVDHTDDDTLIGFLITAARTSSEAFTRRVFITQTWKMFMDGFSSYGGFNNNPLEWSGSQQTLLNGFRVPNSIELPLPPLISITHLKTYDDADVATIFAASNYFVSVYSGERVQPGALTLRESTVWPTVSRVKDGVEIQFVAGYGTDATDVPQQIRMAIQEQAAFLYNNRGSCDGNISLSNTAKTLLTQFRIMKL